MKIYTVPELLEKHTKLRDPVIDGLLREGETMNIIAAPKTGKSMLALDLALSVCTGQPWLETFQTVKGRVLILDNELHEDALAHRVRKALQARGIAPEAIADSLHLASLRGDLINIDKLMGSEAIQKLKEKAPKLIILDALYRMFPDKFDENDNAAIARLYNSLDKIAGDVGCAIVIIHHCTKGSQARKGVSDVGSGGGSQSRAADTHLILRPHKEKRVVVMEAAVRNWPDVAPMCLTLDFPRWVRAPGDPSDLAGKNSKSSKNGKADLPITLGPEAFARSFVSEEPRIEAEIIGAATATGKFSGRKAKELLQRAVREGFVECSQEAPNKSTQYTRKVT